LISRFSAVAAALLMLPGMPALAGTTVTDAGGRAVTISDTSRIVAVGGSIAEILYALGLEDRVAAVDLTSVYPPRAQSKPSVGYMRTLSAEGVLSVNPSVIIAIEGSGPKEAIDVLEAASVPFVLVPEAHDATGVAAKIRLVADAVGEHDKGEVLAAAVEEDLATLATMRDGIAERRQAVFVLSMGSGGAPMVAGSGTLADTIFALAGVDNALSGFTGYKPANEEAVMASEPDAIVLMAERGHGTSAEAVFAMPAFAESPAAKEGRFILLPGSYLLSFGPRTAHAARDLAAAVYPEVALPALPARPWTEDGGE